MGKKLLSLLAATIASALPRAEAVGFPVAGLAESEFRQIGEQGFGDRANSYAWGMAYFKGKLYIGTNRHFLCLIRDSVESTGAGANPEIPRDCEENLLDMDLRARVYTYDPATNAVELVHISPTFSALTSNGTRVDVPRAIGYRTMVVFTEPDGTEALYVGSFTVGSVPSVGARILRCVDGHRFEDVPLDLPYGEKYYSFRSLTVYKDRLYVLGLSSDPTAPDLLEAADPASGDFRAVSTPGFGDPANAGAFELATFAGYLYVGTFAALDGFQLLKTKAEGEPPYVYQKVLEKGAYRGIKNQSVLSLHPFKDHLYVGTGVYFGSINLIPDFQPAPAEVLRVKADDSWEIVCGEERSTPDGFKAPITGAGPGFGNPFTGYIWRMQDHEGVLYLGTLDNSVFAQYAEDVDVDAELLEDSVRDTPLADLLPPLIETLGAEEIADVISAVHGGFDLWRTTDGRIWQIVSYTGFGDQFSYGVRNFASTSAGLFVGTANPFFGLRLHVGQAEGTDSDGDSFADGHDNCPLTWNLNQADLDADGVGDSCDGDGDGDCLAERIDPRPRFAQPDSEDSDEDLVPNRCDDDDDGDGVLDAQDNCPLADNFGQADSIGDGVGDACRGGGPSSGDLPGARPGAANSPENEETSAAAGPTIRPCGVLGGLVGWGIPLGLLAMAPRRRGALPRSRSRGGQAREGAEATRSCRSVAS